MQSIGIFIFLIGVLFFAIYLSFFQEITKEKRHHVFLILALILAGVSGLLSKSVGEAIELTGRSTDSYIGRVLGSILGTMLAQGAFFVLAIFAAIFGMYRQKANERLKEKMEIAQAEMEKTSIEDAARVSALDELESGKLNRLAWAKALEESDGNEARAKSLYIKIRKEEILKQNQHEQKDKKSKSACR